MNYASRMAGSAAPILICTDPTGGNLVPGLPLGPSNVFQRIIRNPRPDSPLARERECTEMLAGVLINAPALRRHLFRWMARRSGLNPDLIDGLEFDIGTEQFIGAKRDDLRVEGRRDRERDGPVALLWTIEVKVGSPFHASDAQRLGDEGEVSDDGAADSELDEQLVNQLQHYDDWLCLRPSVHCGGFVLALRDLTDALPPLGLRRPWTCISWTGLGLQVKAALDTGELPPQDELLAKHLLGFISTNLWRTDEMPNAKLDSNDIALIRAFSKIGRDCERKVGQLLEMVPGAVTRSAVGHGEVRPYNGLYKADACAGFYRFLAAGFTKDADPMLDIAVGCADSPGDYKGVFLEMSPNHPKAEAVRKAAAQSLKILRERNPKWQGGGGQDDECVVLELSAPLTDLLAAEDQQRKLTDFVEAALTDLKESGAVDAVVSALGGSRAAASKT